jgi:hypothetical protein
VDVNPAIGTLATDRAFLDALYGTTRGYVHVAVGRNAHGDEQGRYGHQGWEPKVFAWPDEAEQAVHFMNAVLDEPGLNDLYICPNVLKTTKREKGTAATHRLLHADADHGADPSKIGALHGFAISSGTPGHAQVFVPLSNEVTPPLYQALMEGMRKYFHGDNKISDNDLLRPVGSKNFKGVAVAGLDEPYVVDWMVKPTEGPKNPAAVAAILGVSLPDVSEAPPLQCNSGELSTFQPGAEHVPPWSVNLDLPRYLAVQSSTWEMSKDRSVDTQRIVAAGFRAGLPLGQIRQVVDQRDDLRERLAGRTDDDVSRIYLKLVEEERSANVGAQQHHADEHPEPNESFDRKVAKEVERLRVHQAARTMLANERQGGVQVFDADLLKDVLARPAEDPYRIDGLLPSDAAMLIVAQRKTGKTTLTLNLTRSLITGELFLAKFPVRPIDGRVGVLNYEVSGSQFGMWADQAGVPADRLFLVNLRGRRNPLTDQEDRGRLADLLREQEIEALIVDPFGRACGGTNQNDSGEVGSWLVDLDRFARSEVGALDLIVTAHAGWNGKRTRGSSALEDWADSVLMMTRDDKDEDTRYLRAFGRDVHLEEDRLEFDQPTRSLSLTGSGGQRENRQSGKVDDLVGLVATHVQQQPGSSVADLQRAMRDLKTAGALVISFQDHDVAVASRLAEKQGLLRSVHEGPGKPKRHYPVDPVPTEDLDPGQGGVDK